MTPWATLEVAVATVSTVTPTLGSLKGISANETRTPDNEEQLLYLQTLALLCIRARSLLHSKPVDIKL
jgi:hypothetical protein